jgi:hypothetical protein
VSPTVPAPVIEPAGHRALAAALRAHCDRLLPDERDTLDALDAGDWSALNPNALSSTLERGMDKARRHRRGAHYTRGEDVMRVLRPTLVQPWQGRIDAAHDAQELRSLHGALLRYRVLDPACGGGAFLVLAFEQLQALEDRLRGRAQTIGPEGLLPAQRVSVRQCLGLDLMPLAVATTRAALTATQLQRARVKDDLTELQRALTHTIRQADALLEPWPAVDAVVGNPPFLDGRAITSTHGQRYKAALRRRFPTISGRADYCVHFFHKAHDALPSGGRAGLVGTNSIRENHSREGGLDYILASGGTITEAVATQRWAGDAAVQVSIVCWVKGEAAGPRTLRWQDEAGAWHGAQLDRIPSSLSHKLDVTTARALDANRRPKRCFEGVQPGHSGFCIGSATRAAILARSPAEAALLHPVLNGRELLTRGSERPHRWLIDMHGLGLSEASSHPMLLAHLRDKVLPDWTRQAQRERARSGRPSGEHQRRLKAWWQLKRRRTVLLDATSTLPRYIACARVTKRPIFVFLDPAIYPDSALSVFALADDYSFGVLQSRFHWAWFTARCSTLEARFRYTPSTVWDSFPWPQRPGVGQIEAVAEAARALREQRARVQSAEGIHLRALYRRAERESADPLARSQRALDRAVAQAYGADPGTDPLAMLLEINQACAQAEDRGAPVLGPGLPPWVEEPSRFVSEDRVGAP